MIPNWVVVLVIPVGLALFPLLWAYVSSKWRRMQFESLIYREIEEAGPYPRTKPKAKAKAFQPYTKWTNHHQQKRFLHIEILEKPTENRDFIFALPADLVYLVTQLWNSKDNPTQWLNFLNQIEKQMTVFRERQRCEIRKVKDLWCTLIEEYETEEVKSEIAELKKNW